MQVETATDQKNIWVFTPSRTNPEHLESIFVQRHNLLQDAVERIIESSLTDNKHHLLFIGPRGCGKTHLITLLINRLNHDDKLKKHLRIAWLNENETCTTFLELLIKIHSALESCYPTEFYKTTLEATFAMKQNDALEFISKHLLTSLKSRTLLVVVENLDTIFESLGDLGQKQLRSFIQENPRLSIVATAQRLIKDLSSRISPFFGFFQTEHLKPLNVEQATELLQKIAKLQKNFNIAEYLSTSRGHSRVQAIHHLSGGNYRIYIILSQFISQNSVNALHEPFMKMVDELTPYYQERIHWLPPMQRKIVEYLCSCENTVPVKDIAKRLFATPQTISSQLQDLREKGYVEANQRGRESLYELSEPLMKICVNIKDNQQQQPLQLLVDFLRIWYEDHELKNSLDQLNSTCYASAYLQSAIQKNSSDGNLRNKIIHKDVSSSFPNEFPLTICEEMEQEFKESPTSLVLATQSIKEGKLGEAILYLDKAINKKNTPNTKAKLLLKRAEIHSLLNEPKKEITDLTKVIELLSASVVQAVKTFANSKMTQTNTNNMQYPIGDTIKTDEQSDVSINILAEALVERGATYYKTGYTQHAINDFTKVIEKLPSASTDFVAIALFNRGLIHIQNNRKKKAQNDFETIIDLSTAPVESLVNAHLTLSQLHFGEGQWDKGFQSLSLSLKCGEKTQPAYRSGLTAYLINAIFLAGLNPEGRNNKIVKLVRAYENHHALNVLGEALVQHIGIISRSGKPFPATDNLDGWAAIWEQATKNKPDFSLPLRLFKTGINYIKSGSKDLGVLLVLTSPERTILERTLGIKKQNYP